MPRHVMARDGQRLWRGNAAQTGELCAGDRTQNGSSLVAMPRAAPLAIAILAAILMVAGGFSRADAAPPQPAAEKSAQPVSTGKTLPKPTTDPKTVVTADRMLVEADQSVYEKNANAVILTGKVQIYYKRHTLTADKVTYFNETKRVVAEGNVRLTEPGGNLVKAVKLDVTQGFQKGFIQALTVDSTERTRFQASEAERTGGNVTVFKNGIYSACQACEIDPSRPPFWEIRAAKITHNQDNKTVKYEDAQLEFSGTPVAYLPYFEHPDPTVTRQTGFLMPTASVSTNLGLAVSTPFFWAPTKDWDMTLQPAYLTRQGFLADVQVRHRFEDGTVSVRGIGINQSDPSAFAGTSGNRTTRGAAITTGQFTINDQWKWGWDATLVSDRRFMLDYHEATTSSQEATSQIYLTGLGERTYFDARAYAFQIYTDDDNTLPKGIGKNLQNKQPGVGTIDYDVVFGDPVLGGELSVKTNLTNVYRSTTDLGIANQVYGMAGDFSRASIDVNWRRQFTDGYGQIFEPFAYVRGDLFYNNKNSGITGPGATWVDNATAFRGMPAIGMTYRYPWLVSSAIGNHILEPIGQLVVRPNETLVGKLPNEDAQSLVFDDTTLFQADKFSGSDRAEGGTRANLGMQYTYLMPSGGYISALFGQSYLLAGSNSFNLPRLQLLEQMALAGQAIPLSGIGSGLTRNQSDYVSRLNLETGAGVRFGTSARFSQNGFNLRRADASVAGVAGPLTSTLTWAYLRTSKSDFALINALDPTLLTNFPNLLQPERSELQGSTSLKLSENWRVFGGARFDLNNNFLVSQLAGVGYDNDSFSASLSYSASTDQTLTQAIATNRVLTDRIVYLKIGLRTLGDGSISNGSSTNTTK